MINFLNTFGTWIDIPLHPDLQLDYQRTVDSCWVYDIIDMTIWSTYGWYDCEVVEILSLTSIASHWCHKPAQNLLTQLIAFVEQAVSRVVALCYRLGF
jgi:hypothetical protein